jgi:hypothetical protein
MSSFACSLHSSSCFLVVVGGYFLTKWSDGGVTETEGYLIGHKIRPAGIETQVKEDLILLSSFSVRYSLEPNPLSLLVL